MKEKVVVIGGSGFVGSHLADALTDAGYDVSIFDIIASPWLREEQEMVVGDIIRDEESLAKCLSGACAVYHLAGIADIGQASNSPRMTVEKNIIGSTIVLESCLNAKVERFLFASTVYVYSQQGSFYRVSKQAVELLIEAYHERFGLDYTILRYGSLYGPRAQEWNGLKRFVTQGIKEERIVYPGTGEERREYIHVRDAARLSVQAMDPEYASQRLTITGTQILTSRDLLRMIKEIIGKDIELEFSPEGSLYQESHYSLTPYRYTPRPGKKIVPNEFVDLGEGILELVAEVDDKCNGLV